MDTSIVVIWVLTNLIMLTSGYLLGVKTERKQAIRFTKTVWETIAKEFIKPLTKEKNAKHANRT